VALSEFVATLSNRNTRQVYAFAIRDVLGDVDSFLALDPAGKESFLLRWAAANRERLSSSSLRLRVAAVKAFCDSRNVQLNWRRVVKRIPPGGRTKKRAVSLEELRTLFETSDVRGKFIISLMASSGIRVGAWDWLSMRDLVPRPSGIGELTVYRGEPEEYTTFVSSECIKLFGAYLKERKRDGEKLGPEGPLLRNPVNPRAPGRRVARSGGTSVKTWLYRRWGRHGLGGGSREFKSSHGFRRFFKTRLEWAGMKTLFVEKLMGHALGLADSYTDFGPELEREYLKFQHALCIDRALQAEEEAERKVEESRAALQRQVDELKEAYMLSRVRQDRLEAKVEEALAKVTRAKRLLAGNLEEAE
jgi:hypothetical protein